jgi:hypothetical protein
MDLFLYATTDADAHGAFAPEVRETVSDDPQVHRLEERRLANGRNGGAHLGKFAAGGPIGLEPVLAQGADIGRIDGLDAKRARFR